MNKLSILGLFCEDIREELNQQFSIIGTISDTVDLIPRSAEDAKEVSGAVKMMGKLCIFVRANFDPEDPIKEIHLRLVTPEGHNLPVGGADGDLIEKAKTEAKQKRNLLAGVVLRVVLDRLPIKQEGYLKLESDIGGETRILAALRVNFASSQASSTEPPPPS